MQLDAPVSLAKSVAPPASAEFSGHLYTQLSASEGNLFFSPFSIYSALGSLAAGTKGESRAELSSQLGLGQDNAYLDALSAYGKAITTSTDYRFTIANGLFLNDKMTFQPSYLKDAARVDTEVQPVDFSKLQAAIDRINHWVEKKTDGKIKDILKPNALHESTAMVIANAVYFHGEWVSPFDANLTQPRDFTLEDGSKRKVSAMQLGGTEEFPYLSNRQVEMASLPYQGDRLAMAVLLPKRKLSDLEQSLAAKPGQFAEWIDAAKPENLAVQLPKFTYETAYDLIPTLQAIGINRIFSEAKADLSGISGVPCAIDAKRCLSVSLVIHQAFIGVNEKGTEAAAATVIGDIVTGGAPENPTPFTVDRPFLFVIYDKRTKTILFMGRYSDPKPA